MLRERERKKDETSAISYKVLFILDFSVTLISLCLGYFLYLFACIFTYLSLRYVVNWLAEFMNYVSTYLIYWEWQASLPNTLLTANAHPVRESELPYSPFPMSQSMPNKYGNTVSSFGGSSISVAEVRVLSLLKYCVREILIFDELMHYYERGIGF